MHDYKGNEIYEDDIIRSFDSKGDPIIHIIDYDCDEACFVARLNGSGKYTERENDKANVGKR